MKKSSRGRSLLVLAILILFPPTLIFIFAYSKQHFGTLDYLGPKSVNRHEVDGKMVADTVYYKLPNVSVKNLEGEAINLSDFKGKVCVTEFFSNLPQLRDHYREFEDVEDVVLISFLMNATPKSIEKLKDFIERINLDNNKWVFLSGDPERMDSIAINCYFPDTELKDSIANLKKHNLYTLVDKDGHPRGRYDHFMFKYLEEDIRMLKKEEDVSKARKED